MKPLSTFFATLTLDIALLTVSVFWLAGQFSVIQGWAAIGGIRHSLQIDQEGWMWQQFPCGNAQRFGVRTHDDDLHKNGLDWKSALSDGELTNPMPGVLRYRSPWAGAPLVRLVAVRHWLVFLVTFGTWCGWRVALRRWLTSHDESPHISVDS